MIRLKPGSTIVETFSGYEQFFFVSAYLFLFTNVLFLFWFFDYNTMACASNTNRFFLSIDCIVVSIW